MGLCGMFVVVIAGAGEDLVSESTSEVEASQGVICSSSSSSSSCCWSCSCSLLFSLLFFSFLFPSSFPFPYHSFPLFFFSSPPFSSPLFSSPLLFFSFLTFPFLSSPLLSSPLLSSSSSSFCFFFFYIIIIITGWRQTVVAAHRHSLLVQKVPVDLRSSFQSRSTSTGSHCEELVAVWRHGLIACSPTRPHHQPSISSHEYPLHTQQLPVCWMCWYFDVDVGVHCNRLLYLRSFIFNGQSSPQPETVVAGTLLTIGETPTSQANHSYNSADRHRLTNECF